MAPAQKRVGWYKRLFASMMNRAAPQHDALMKDRKMALLGGLRGRVLEIGPGTGPNLAYYARDVEWLGIEPNPAMFPYAQAEAQRLGLSIELREGTSESLPVADHSMDVVVSTLVLCSVHDPRKSLQEILRVLKPSGRFIFVEHVAAPQGTGLRRFQGLIKPLWKLGSDGCSPDRETWAMIENAGFSHVEIAHFDVALPIVGPHIAGVAVK